MDPKEKFLKECAEEIEQMGEDKELHEQANDFIIHTSRHKYSYHFTWMGRPIIQYPQDMVAMQELIWKIKPELIIETGIAHGGSLILYASILELIGKGTVVGVDIDIRSHNRIAIEEHPMYKRIALIEGSSVSEEVIDQVKEMVRGKSPVMVLLDSNHSHAHVAGELRLYSPFVTKGSYLVVFDTIIEEMPVGSFDDRPWGKSDNPMTAVEEFLRSHQEFVVDKHIHNKLLITVARNGYLKRK